MRELLPKEIVWRPKVVLSEGAGVRGNNPISGLFSDIANTMLSDHEFREIVRQHDAWSISTKEEAVYFKIFSGYGYHKFRPAQKRVFANKTNTL
jgi:hypothetical protein